MRDFDSDLKSYRHSIVKMRNEAFKLGQNIHGVDLPMSSDARQECEEITSGHLFAIQCLLDNILNQLDRDD